MIKIDPNVTEMPKSIPWIEALTITAAVVIGRALYPESSASVVDDEYPVTTIKSTPGTENDNE